MSYNEKVMDIVQNYKPTERDSYIETFTPKLYNSICVPSSIHSYSLAIEYMKNWYLNRIPKYYKSTYINGSHLSIEYAAFNADIQKKKKEKPMLAIMPEMDMEYDRETLDNYYLPTDMMLFGHNAHCNNIFIRDYENNIGLGVGFEQMAINFTFRSRVSTQAQQYDLRKQLNMSLQIGGVFEEYISADIHIPTEIIFSIAELAGFEILYNEDDTPIRVKNITNFISYLNKHSSIPIIYKFRGINGNFEFFARVPNIYIHIASPDKLDLDQGEMKEKTRTNFHIDYRCRMLMTVPNYYFLMYNKPTKIMIPKIEADVLGILNMKVISIPEIDENGWERFITTQYQEEVIPDKYPYRINIKELLEDPSISLVVDYCKNQSLSPSIFLNFVFLNDEQKLKLRIDWDTFDMLIEDEMSTINSFIAIYRNNEFINMTLENIKNMKEERID